MAVTRSGDAHVHFLHGGGASQWGIGLTLLLGPS
jgi:hypothetical protein